MCLHKGNRSQHIVIDITVVTAQQQPQPQQQNNHNCIWVETKHSLATPPPTRNSKLHDRAEIEQNSENKSHKSI